MSVRDIVQSAASSAGNSVPTTYDVNAVFDTYLYTGNGSTQTITNGIDLAGNGGLVWVKTRGVIGDHVLIDTVRGGTNMLTSNDAYQQVPNADAITSFNSTGYSFGLAGSGFSMNTSSVSYVSWIFRKAAKFFDIVTWTGDENRTRTIPHNLGVTPGCIIVKSATNSDVPTVWHNSYTGAGLYLHIATVYPGDGARFSTSQSSTTINLSSPVNSSGINAAGQTYVAYVFAHNTAADSMINCGSYTGNGSATGPTVSLGWEPQYLMIKNVTGVGSWQMVDNMRGMAADGNNAVLNADTTAAEFTGTFVASTSTGFQLKTAAAGFNSSGATYIYIAIRAPTTPAISLYGNPFFSTYLYTGNGTSQTITNGIDLAANGGMVWLKCRNAASQGIICRPSYRLYTSVTNGEEYSTNVTAFNSDGFSVGSDVQGNISGNTYVSWTFRKAAKFFDIVTWTGDGTSLKTLSHSLGIIPGMTIIKRTNAAGPWIVIHNSYGNWGYTSGYDLLLNSPNWQSWWNGSYTLPTDTQFSVGTSANQPGDSSNESGATYVAYLFAHNTAADSMIKCGKYTGNGSATGPIVSLGWEPEFLLIKNATGVGSWQMVDNMRGMTADGNDAVLNPDTTAAEFTGTFVAPTSTGFQINTAASGFNTSNATYIYMAIRRPTNLPTSGTQVFSCSYGLDTTPSVKAFNSPIAVDLLLAKVAAGPCYVQDRLRGAPQYMSTESTGGENASADWRMDTMNGVNHISARSDLTTRMGWMVKRAPGFFDIVCWTGVSGYQDVNHSLGVIPELLIYRSRTIASDWNVVAKASTGYGGLKLNITNGQNFSFVETAAGVGLTSTTFNPVYSFGNTSSPSVAYLFATLAGISKVGSYTGNGSTQTISCGFAAGARFILIKRIDASGDWYIWDTVRGIVGGNDPYVTLNTTAAEATDDSIDPDNSGFIVNQLAATNINVTSATYIFLAIA